jgi:putative DNA primase/helicase
MSSDQETLDAQIRRKVLEKRIEKAAKEMVRQEQPAPELLLRKASSVANEKLKHLFGGRLVYGAFQMMIGPGEVGKGMVSVDIIARLSSGSPFPGENGTIRNPINVLVCVTEDSAQRVKARLMAAEADLDRVFFIDGPPAMRGGLIVPSPIAFDDDAGALVKLAKDENIGAMFLETTVEHLGDREGYRKWSTNNDMEVRKALSPIVAVCRETGIIGWGVMHPRKSVDGSLDDMISGSAAFRNVSRGIMYVMRDPADQSSNPSRVLCCNKSNYLRHRPATYKFSVEPWEKDPDEGHVVWGIEGRTLEDERTAEDIWSQFQDLRKDRPRRDRSVIEAEEFLKTMLESGVNAPAALKQLAKEDGISWQAIKDAKNNLRIASIKEGMPGRVVRWAFNDEEDL